MTVYNRLATDPGIGRTKDEHRPTKVDVHCLLRYFSLNLLVPIDTGVYLRVSRRVVVVSDPNCKQEECGFLPTTSRSEV